jgi:hypothetical protein
MLALYVQPGPGGDQDLDIGSRPRDVCRYVYALEQVLEIVQDEEHILPSHIVEQLLSRISPSMKLLL